MARKYVHYSASVASGSGTVSPIRGTTSYDTSSASSVSVTFTASPSSGYVVDYWWFQDAAGTYSPRGSGRTSYTFPADMDFTCKVYFKRSTPSYTVTVEGSHCSVSGGGSYTSGSTCTARCTPNTGYHFRYWEDGDGDIVSYSNPYSFTVTRGTYLYAVCDLNVYTVYVEHDNYCTTNISSATVQHGRSVSLKATLNDSDHYDFDRWDKNGTSYSTNPSISPTINGDNWTFSAFAKPKNYTVTVNGDSGCASVHCNGQQGNTTVSVTCAYNTNANISVTLKDGYRFVRWSITNPTGSWNDSHNNLNVTVKGNTLCTAVTEPILYYLYYDLNSGTGTVPQANSAYLGGNVTVRGISSDVHKDNTTVRDEERFWFHNNSHGTVTPGIDDISYTATRYWSVKRSSTTNAPVWKIENTEYPSYSVYNFSTTGDKTAYLQWTYTDGDFVYGDLTFPSSWTANTGYYLVGFSKNADTQWDSGEFYPPGTTIHVDGNTPRHWYAIWEPLVPFKVVFGKYNNAIKVDNVTITYTPYVGASTTTKKVWRTDLTDDYYIIYAHGGTTASYTSSDVTPFVGYHFKPGGSRMSIFVGGSYDLIVLASPNTYTVEFKPGRDNVSGRGPYPDSGNKIECTYDESGVYFPDYGWTYNSKLELYPGKYGWQFTLHRTVLREPTGWRKGSTVYHPGDLLKNLTTVDGGYVEVVIDSWTAGSYTLTTEDKQMPASWQYDFLGYTYSVNPSDEEQRYNVGSTITNITADVLNMYAQWGVVKGTIHIHPSSTTSHLDKFDRIRYKYYHSSGELREGYTTLATFNLYVEWGYDYFIWIDAVDGYRSMPPSYFGTMDFSQAQAGSYVLDKEYSILPQWVTTNFIISPGDLACSFYINDERKYSGNSITDYNGTEITLKITQDTIQRNLYEFVGWYDQSGYCFSTSETTQYTIKYSNATVKALFRGRVRLVVKSANATEGLIQVEYNGETSNWRSEWAQWVDIDEHVTIRAKSNNGYSFSRWSNECIETEQTLVIIKDSEYIASFGKSIRVITYTLPAEAGTVKIKYGNQESEAGSTSYLDCVNGNTVSLYTYNSDPLNYRFKYWGILDTIDWKIKKYSNGYSTVDATSTLDVIVSSMSYNTFYAVYDDPVYSVEIKKEGEGSVTAVHNGSTYYEGDTIVDINNTDIVAFAANSTALDQGYKFKRWIIKEVNTGRVTYNDGTWQTQTINTFSISSWSDDYVVTAVFGLAEDKLKVNVTVSIYSSGSYGEYDGTCAPRGMWWEEWYNMCSPYYTSGAPGLGGQCTWYAHGRTAQMRGNVHAGAPFGNGVDSSGDGWNGNAENWKFSGYHGGNWVLSTSPSVGDVAVWSAWNHVGVVEAVGEDEAGPYVCISEWNRPSLGLSLRSNNISTYRQDFINSMGIVYLTNPTNPVINIKPNAEGAETYSSQSWEIFEVSNECGYVTIQGGTTISESTHAFDEGDSCFIQAFATNGFEFVGWKHKGSVSTEDYMAFDVNENTEGTYVAMFWAPGYGGSMIPPTPEELLESQYSALVYYYMHSMYPGEDYWNYKYNKWLNVGDKKR